MLNQEYSQSSSLPETRNNLGVAYHVQGKVSLAINEYGEALKTSPDYADAHNNLGTAYFGLGLVDLAIKELQEATRLDPGLAQIHHNLGVAYKAQGKLELAKKECEIALSIDHNDADTCFTQGEVYEIMGITKDAIECYQRFIELAPLEDADWIGEVEERICQLRKKTVVKTYDSRQTLSVAA